MSAAKPVNKPRSAAWEMRGRWSRRSPRVPGADSEERLVEERGGYVWFDGVRVFAEDMRLLCVVGGRLVPLPVAILHPDCRLAADGDVGRLGVPRRWAEQQGLCA